MAEISTNFDLILNPKKNERIVCKECSRETVHSIISTYTENGNEECGNGNSVQWCCHNQIIQCLGCETVSFRTVSTCSEEYDYDENNQMYAIKTIKYYPGRNKEVKSINSYSLPYSIQKIYEETILAIENELFILAGVGIRAIIETICKDLSAIGNNLYNKIDDLKEKSFITPEGANILHKLRGLGNDAAHEVKAHDSKQLELAMHIIDHMLDSTYIIPNKVKEVFPDAKKNKEKI